MISILLIVAGAALLYFGGEMLVSSSIRLAQSFGVSPLVIGLTIVAFATSAPELAATLTAAFRGAPDIAVGNAFGSNVANLGLILGLSVLFAQVQAKPRFVRREMVFMVLVTGLMYPLMSDGLLGRLGGLILLALLGGFLYVLLQEKEGVEDVEVETDPGDAVPMWRSLLILAAGIGLLVAGAQVLVKGAVQLAEAMGIPERIVGLTLVALGTSLPELATSLVAARRNQADIVLGNVIGSNIFNLLCILGLTSLVHPITVNSRALNLDFWVMLGISVLLLIFLATRPRLRWPQGATLLAIYLGYNVYLFASV